ncbi:MAG TPA: MFS transporter [Streptosporangiaceae bacterium]|jgi:MFS family permease
MSGTPAERGSSRRASGPWLALRSPGFRWLVSGQLISNLGDGVYAVALPWYVLSHHGSSVLLGAVLAAYGIPRTALLIVGGQMADRFGPSRVMLGADLGRLVLAALLATVALPATLRPQLLVAIAAGIGAGEGLFLPASFSAMPSIVEDSQLPSGNALMSSGVQLAAFAGPALGGLVVATAGAGTGFALDAVSFGVSTLTLWRLTRIRAPRAGIRPVAAHGGQAGLADRPAAAGVWAFCRCDRVFLLIVALTLAANLGSGGSAEVALPVFARQTLHGSAASYGALIAAAGIGALAGSLLAARLPGGRRPATIAGAAFFGEAVLLAALAAAVRLPLAVVTIAAFGMLNAYGNVIMQTAFQRWAPRELLGRLSGLLLTASLGIFPVSVAVAGLLVRRFGPGAFFLASGVTLAITLLVALSAPTFRDFGAPPAPARRTEPARPARRPAATR